MSKENFPSTRKFTDDELRNRKLKIQKLYVLGLGNEKIHKRLGTSKSVITRILKEFLEENPTLKHKANHD